MTAVDFLCALDDVIRRGMATTGERPIDLEVAPRTQRKILYTIPGVEAVSAGNAALLGYPVVVVPEVPDGVVRVRWIDGTRATLAAPV